MPSDLMCPVTSSVLSSSNCGHKAPMVVSLTNSMFKGTTHWTLRTTLKYTGQVRPSLLS